MVMVGALDLTNNMFVFSSHFSAIILWTSCLKWEGNIGLMRRCGLSSVTLAGCRIAPWKQH